MSDRQSYPSPTAAATRPGVGPFYGEAAVDASPEAQVPHLELADDDKAQPHQELLAELNQHINPDLQHSGPPDSNIMASHNGAQHIAREVMNLDQDEHNSPFPMPNENHSEDATPGASTSMASRPRTKVSRACDECRRKKIRCDATAENDASSCSACKKSGFTCQFSRTPQKRGPSKGYIKELADRVSSLEGQLKYGETSSGAEISHEENQFILDSTLSALASGLKRTHSMSEGLNDHYTASERNGFQPEEPNLSLQFDEGIASLYYQSIHPFLPFLPNGGIPMLREEVAHIPTATRKSLLAAMEVTLRSVQYSGVQDVSGPTHEKADELMRASLFADQVGLPHLQSLLFLTIDASNRGGSVSQGGHGPKPSNYLAQAIQEARNLELFSYVLIQRSVDENALVLARSIAVCITVLDTMTAAANKRPGMRLSWNMPITMPGDLNRIGARLFWLGRLCTVMMHLNSIDIGSDSRTQDQFELRFGGTKISIEQRSSLIAHKKQVLFGLDNVKQACGAEKDTILNLACWYIWGYVELYFWPIVESQNLFFCVKRIIELLNSPQLSGVSPLTHHFSGLATHILFQLTDFTNTRSEAVEMLGALDSVLNHLVPHSDSQSFDAAIRDAVSKKHLQMSDSLTTSPTMGLEHLANAAVRTSNTDGAGEESTGAQQAAPPVNDGGVAAAAEAAAKAAQLQISVAASKTFDPEIISQEGYLFSLFG